MGRNERTLEELYDQFKPIFGDGNTTFVDGVARDQRVEVTVQQEHGDFAIKHVCKHISDYQTWYMKIVGKTVKIVITNIH